MKNQTIKSDAAGRRSKWLFSLLVIVFFGPFLVAWGLYQFGGTNWVKHTVNHGILVQPPISFNALYAKKPDGSALGSQQMQGKWWLIFATKLPCKATCEQNLYKIRQVRRALGKDQDRVERLVLTIGKQSDSSLNNLLATEYNGTQHAMIEVNQLQKLLTPAMHGKTAISDGSLYLVDPRGNLFMVYDAQIGLRDLYNDLTRLLKVSSIG